MSNIKHKTRLLSGFTLLEISIVVVVIGLLIGAIVAGRALIEASEYRAQIDDINKLQMAVSTFKTKYNCLPGDCIRATTYFSATSQPSAVTDGNGDGKINIANVATTAGDQYTGWTQSLVASGYAEWAGVFDQLGLAGLWNLPPYDEMNISPSSRFDGIACPKMRITTYGNQSDVAGFLVPTCLLVGYIPGYRYVTNGHKIAMAGGPVGAGGTGGINPWEAYALEIKMDDGAPYTGKMVVMNKDYIYQIPDYPDFLSVPYMAGCTANSSNSYLSRAQIDSGGQNQRTRMCNLYIDTDSI